MNDDDTLDLQQLLREIDEEVEARRAAGDFPPGMERDLDLIFARFAPAITSGNDLDALIEQADRGAYVDVDVPTGSRIPGVAIVKRVLHKLMSWYLRYVAQQVSVFAGATVGALKLLGRRVEILEAATPGADPKVRDASRKISAPPDASTLAAAIADHVKAAGGRVLVAECGSGGLVRVLLDAGVDAYGCEPRLSLAEEASLQGIDVRGDDVLDHLRAVDHEALAGLVLTGAVDRLPVGAQLTLVDLAAAALRRGGRLALVGTQPDAWGRSTSVVDADLAPGKPLHAETWAHVLGERGFATIEHVDAAPLHLVLAVRG
jgi:hypothetical protein